MFVSLFKILHSARVRVKILSRENKLQHMDRKRNRRGLQRVYCWGERRPNRSKHMTDIDHRATWRELSSLLAVTEYRASKTENKNTRQRRTLSFARSAFRQFASLQEMQPKKGSRTTKTQTPPCRSFSIVLEEVRTLV